MKTYGIWGLGIVGSSVIRFLHRQGYQLSVHDSRTLSPDEKAFLKQYGVQYYPPSDTQRFLQESETIIPSPGIDISAVAHQATFVHELDLFIPHWHNPLIAVTGSLGKTTLVTVLNQLLSAQNYSIAMGGNIGIPMLDLLAPKITQGKIDYGLLEVSSFQLEHAQPFSPTLAIITNLHANHLDRHGSLDSYFDIKYAVLQHQRPDQKALVPLSLASRIRKYTDRPLVYFTAGTPTSQHLNALTEGDILYTLEAGTLIRSTMQNNTLSSTRIALTPDMLTRGSILVKQTWITALAVCDMLGFLTSGSFVMPELTALEHRVEYLGEYGGKQFYNDSKSTIFEATSAAVALLAPRKIHLLLGGLSKGVDRGKLLSQLKDQVVSTTCFGKEADHLSESCRALGIATSAHATLEGALEASLHDDHADTILLSPAGTSYDLYKNYKERGNHFKQLVKKISL